MTLRTTIPVLMITGALMLPLSGSFVRAQHTHEQAPGADQTTMEQRRETMMREIQASSAKLDELVQKMNAAEGTEKVDAMAALLTAMVDEQKKCKSMMTDMGGDMGSMMNMMKMMGGMKK